MKISAANRKCFGWIVAFWAASSGVLTAIAGPFAGHKVVSVPVADAQQLERLKSLSFEIWSCAIGIGRVDVQVTPEQLDQLRQSGLPFSVWIEDVDALVDRQYQTLRGVGWHDDYHDLAGIENHIAQYIADHPGLATAQTFGTSLEGRLMRGIRIAGPGVGPEKPAFLFHGGQHAREWVSPATVVWFIEHLLTQYGVDPLVTRLINDMEWFILPVMNPDGYAYTWADSANRFWRKNRRNNGDGTFGVDLNRNWGVGFGGTGSSNVTSDSTYRGAFAFSEPETQAIRDFVMAHPNITAYIDFHSYSELILWPWGYTPNLSPDDAAFAEIGNEMFTRIQSVHGHSYGHGPVYSTIYPAAGVASDWVYGTFLQDRFIGSFAFELRDTGAFGFLLPPEQIVPTAEENLEAVLTLARAMSEPFRVELTSPLPSAVTPGATFSVIVEVTARWDPTDTVSTVSVFHRMSGGTYTELNMQTIGGGRYQATLTPSSCNTPMEFYFRVTSDRGWNSYAPELAPRELFRVTVESGSTVSLFDDLEIPSGWTVGDGGDNAISGQWVRVDPNGTLAQPEMDHTPSPGTQCFVTGQGPLGGSLGFADVDMGRTTLFSPTFTLPANGWSVSYARWYSNNQGSAPNADQFDIYMSNDGGSSWTLVESVSENAVAWVVHSFRPADLGLFASNQMILRFIASDYGAASIVEAGVDDLAVSQSSCAAADGDANGDSLVNLADHNSLAGCLNGPSVKTVSAPCGVFNLDFDSDVDMDDYQLFLDRFGAP